MKIRLLILSYCVVTFAQYDRNSESERSFVKGSQRNNYDTGYASDIAMVDNYVEWHKTRGISIPAERYVEESRQKGELHSAPIREWRDNEYNQAGWLQTTARPTTRATFRPITRPTDTIYQPRRQEYDEKGYLRTTDRPTTRATYRPLTRTTESIYSRRTDIEYDEEEFLRTTPRANRQLYQPTRQNVEYDEDGFTKTTPRSTARATTRDIYTPRRQGDAESEWL